MNLYRCFKCESKFKNSKTVITHLKYDHGLKDHSEQLKCVVNGKQCDSVFLTFKGLTNHLKTCEPVSIDAEFEDNLNYNPSESCSEQEFAEKQNDVSKLIDDA